MHQRSAAAAAAKKKAKRGAINHKRRGWGEEGRETGLKGKNPGFSLAPEEVKILVMSPES